MKPLERIKRLLKRIMCRPCRQLGFEPADPHLFQRDRSKATE